MRGGRGRGAYAARQCAVLTSRMLLPGDEWEKHLEGAGQLSPYAMPGTDLLYGAGSLRDA
eukprot:2128031-Rhodomonas_salina.1